MPNSGHSRKVIVTGGAGYIAGITAEWFSRAGYSPVLLDNFSTSRRRPSYPFPLFEVDLADFEATRKAMNDIGDAHAVVHFAARALVPESVAQPELYFRNNLLSTLNMAQLSVERRVRFFVHSSSCAVYGVPEEVPIRETCPLAPITPYGESKLLAERMLAHFRKFKGLKTLNLRYFNPAGALDGGVLGEAHEPETHLVPNVVKAFLEDKSVSVFGTDYPTPDGTCIRDFIHIEDLAEAHVCALHFLEETPDPPFEEVNLGGGRGTSVKEIIDAAERVFGRQARVETHPRRPGDPPRLVANAERAEKWLRWKTRRGIEDMLRSHAEWERRRKSA